MSRRRSSVGLFVASLLLAALPMSSLAQGPAPSIDGIDWRLTQLAGSGVPFIDVPADVAASMRIDGVKAGGQGGCNQWFADAVVDGAKVTFGDIGSTKMACGDPAMSIESAWLGYLPQVSAWSITDGRLELSDTNGAVLLAFEQPSTSPIEGIKWLLEHLRDRGALAPVPTGVVATLDLTAGMASGEAGCSQLFGTYTLSGTALAFADLMRGDKACPEPRMSVQEAYLAALGSVSSWRRAGSTLELVDAPGNVVATFTQASAPSSTTTVSLGLYSGRPDPSWTLTDAQSAELGRLIDSLPSAVGEPPQGGLGYHGFSIGAADAGGADRMLVAYRGAIATLGSGSGPYRQDAARTVERYLLDTGRPYLSAGEIDAVETDLSTT